MRYRQLRDDELSQLAHNIQVAEYAKNITAFARDIYGKQAYQVLIKDDGDTYGGLDVEDIEVTDEQSNEFLPDFTLSYWQQLFRDAGMKDESDFFDEGETWQKKMDRVKRQIKDDEVYSNYDIDPEDSGRVIFLHGLESRWPYPELYVKEED